MSHYVDYENRYRAKFWSHYPPPSKSTHHGDRSSYNSDDDIDQHHLEGEEVDRLMESLDHGHQKDEESIENDTKREQQEEISDQQVAQDGFWFSA